MKDKSQNPNRTGSDKIAMRTSILALASLLLLTACREQSTGDTLIAISSHPETMLYEFQWAFEPWYRERTGRDIAIDWLDLGGSAKMQSFLLNEFQGLPDGVGIDMIWGGGTDPYFELARRDLLEPYRLDESLLRTIPADYNGVPLYDPEYRWYAAMLAGFGIVYNRRVLKLQNLPTPQTWADLTNPAFRSWVGLADPRQSGSSHMALEIILQAYGWEKGWEIITLTGANIKTFSRLASDVPKDVSLGEIACGPCIDFYAYAQMAFTGRDILGYVMPEGLTVVNPDSIAILKGAPNREAARLFLEFVVTEPGQRLLMAPIGKLGGPRQFRFSRMSVLPDLYDVLGEDSLVPVNPFRTRAALRYDSTKGSARWKVINDLIGVLIIENHEILQEAWRVVGACDSDQQARLCRQLARMPVTEKEAMALVRETWKAPVARNRVMLDWSRFAREKYNNVLLDAEEMAK